VPTVASTSVLAFFVLEIVIDPSLCYAQIGFAFLPKKKSACNCKLGRNSSLGSLPVSRTKKALNHFWFGAFFL
ncbi:MAG: hypothetical protein J6C61_08430, partial [Clostridia bacterium]|nr:hypothetical protein [Clostridia bacterium]